MPLLHLVRHGRPAATWGQDPDPGLDATGFEQARATADALAGKLQISPLYSSPLRRCRETAQALEQAWGRTAAVCHEVAEIPSPALQLADRQQWLMQAMRGSWQELQQSAPPGSVDYLQWRQSLLTYLTAQAQDCVIFTHFIAINVAVGAARHSDAVIGFRPDHASVTTVETDGAALRIVQLGREADTLILARH